MDSSPQRSHSCSLLTPTYRPDLARCELLVESLQRCCPSIQHQLIVDRRDVAAFRHLADRAPIRRSEQLLPWWVHRLPGRRSIWLSLRTRPTRGWIIQQVLKIAAAAELEKEVAVFCDSDVAFVRPFDMSELFPDRQVELLDVDHSNDEIVRWTQVACRLLGLDPATVTPRGHVGNLIFWRPEVVRGMIRHIETATGGDWRKALLALPTFSEYVLYGVYVRAVLGYEASGHVPSTRPLVKASWGVDLSSPGSRAAFFAEFEPETVAVMVHSKDGIDIATYRDLVTSCWSRSR